jgi:hypothetical protein
VVGPSEHSIEPLGSIKVRKYREHGEHLLVSREGLCCLELRTINECHCSQNVAD